MTNISPLTILLFTLGALIGTLGAIIIWLLTERAQLQRRCAQCHESLALWQSTASNAVDAMTDYREQRDAALQQRDQLRNLYIARTQQALAASIGIIRRNQPN